MYWHALPLLYCCLTSHRNGQISSVQNWLPVSPGSVQEQSEEQSVGTAEQSSIQFWDSDEEGETSSENPGMLNNTLRLSDFNPGMLWNACE
jgi:hypothetical protein